mgnify:CR=1 FL=1
MSNNKQKYNNPSILSLVSRIVKKQNIDALAGAIEHLINNKQLRLKFSEAARKRALKHFSIEASVKSYQVLVGL